MSVNFLVTLVIPILNEAESLPELLQALKAQSHRPDEIIFSDAGSSDGSPTMIKAWWREEGWENASCRVLSLPGAMPGAGRNAGVQAARNEWIAFIDGGITPASDWLEQLCRHAQAKQSPVVFGVCHFSAQTRFAKAVCALSYGHGRELPVLPASLFARRVFTEIGWFPANLRSAEDLVWISALQKLYGPKEVCWVARVSYTHFPMSWREAFRKWRIYELNLLMAGVRIRQQALYLTGLPVLYVSVGAGGLAGFTLFLMYLLLRGVIDPIRRSSDWPWWGCQPGSAFITLPLAVVLDIAKWTGIVQGVLAKLVSWSGFGGKQHVHR